MNTRLTARVLHERIVACTRAATSARDGEVRATSPSIPAVLRPALRCVTCRTLTSVFDLLRRLRARGVRSAYPRVGLTINGAVVAGWCVSCLAVGTAR